MAQVILYTKPFCPFCVNAIQLLRLKKVNFEEIDIQKNPDQRAIMVNKSGGGTTVPQIFIGGDPIGGCDELFVLERAGHLDGMLEAP